MIILNVDSVQQNFFEKELCVMEKIVYYLILSLSLSVPISIGVLFLMLGNSAFTVIAIDMIIVLIIGNAFLSLGLYLIIRTAIRDSNHPDFQ